MPDTDTQSLSRLHSRRTVFDIKTRNGLLKEQEERIGSEGQKASSDFFLRDIT